ncbi:hypothetical protein SEA_SPILLED_42 [Streptomyces phage Spilled]|jgi:hypothetical protein|uniref:Uncharacterized protein n=3 Tax=Streptomyces virus Karimac TaxID=2846401 RepID=A0A5Q2WMS3_9CAUD|nr:hypothetical protein HWB80_gp239 [Streptomyces phage Karimac]QFP97355.1 hypothetical protein SEA_ICHABODCRANE_39 [Streptomyces phage IchabodCrane]QGH79812.1 hypothetical protein SEA_BORDEAUX_40 [Streptomyces phage Bordeaux]QPL13680.1 hypothetical protein SEA_MINDFLAYER_40 [Streptomyces phage MindFlayer]QRI45728.1 hypothetical protein SEA_BATTUTA_40 [Streptomyces phage Battuta]URM86616.1 hypothetical protein SEA_SALTYSPITOON_42 [Streptomyces phage SaltySpitoon]URM87569.1 hypothetical protei
MRNVDRYYLKYELDGQTYETDALYPIRQARVEKSILEEDGAKNVRIVKYVSVLD